MFETFFSQTNRRYNYQILYVGSPIANCLFTTCLLLFSWMSTKFVKNSNKTLKISNNNKMNKSNENGFSPFFEFHKRIKFLSICEVYWSKQAFCFGLLVSLKLWVSFMDCSRWLYIWFTMKTHIIFIFCIPMFHGLFLNWWNISGSLLRLIVWYVKHLFIPLLMLGHHKGFCFYTGSYFLIKLYFFSVYHTLRV